MQPVRPGLACSVSFNVPSVNDKVIEITAVLCEPFFSFLFVVVTMRHSRCVSEALKPERVRQPRLQAVPGKFLGTRSLVDITPSNCKRNGPEITIHPIEIDSRLLDCLFDIT